MAISERKKKKFVELLDRPGFAEEVRLEIETQRVDPYPRSRLPYWMSLETWTEAEGIYVLAGIDPQSVIVEHGGLGDPLMFTDAMPFEQSESFAFDPVEACSESEFPGSEEAYQWYLENYEKKSEILRDRRAIVSTLTHVLHRSVAGLGQPAITGNYANSYRPQQFVDWALSISFEPQWLKWARSKNYFCSKQHEAQQVVDRPLSTTERHTLLTVIAALCDYSAININERGTAKQISDLTLQIGAEVSDDTVRSILKKIPDAVESRKK